MSAFGLRNWKYGRLLKYTLRQWPALVMIVALTVACSAVTVLQPWPLKILVDYALGNARLPLLFASLLGSLPVADTSALVFLAAIATIGLFGVTTLLDIALTWGWASCGQRAVYGLAADMFQQLQRLSLVFHSGRTVGDSLSRLTGDTYCVYTATQTILIGPGQHLLTLAAVGAVAWHLDPRLTVLTFAIAPLQALVAFFFGERLKHRARQNRKAQSGLVSFVHQTLTSIPMVQAFGAEERNRRRFGVLAAESIALSQRGTLVSCAYDLINGFIATIGTTIVLYAGAQQVMVGLLSVGSFLVFLAYMRSLQSASYGLLRTYANLKTLDVSIDRVLEILQADDPVEDSPGARPLPPLVPGQRGHVRIESVTFGYEPGRPVLKDVTVEARPGETIALIGTTGAGKSTLVSLIPRFFDPWQGRVTIDGVDVRDVMIASLRAQVALVLQEPFLLPLSVADNIAYGRPHATNNEIIAAATAANADAFIRRLPEGYGTVIGERGATLSGGEKQRLAIARALLKNAPILILDEPTSNLDAKTESSLLEALERLMAGRTTFIIAHRLSTIRHADRIVVIENGQLVETGTHQELLAFNGRYREVHSLQCGEPASEVAG